MKNKEIKVGKSPTKLVVILMILLCAFLSLIFGNLLCISLSKPELFLLVFVIIFALFLFLYIPTFIGCYTYWTVDSSSLTYYSSPGYSREIAYAMAVLFHKEHTYTMKLQVSEIRKVDVYWTSRYFIWASRMYPVMLGIEMQDGTTIRFEALYDDKEAFVDALQYLQDDLHIEIHDPYRLLQAMQDPKQNLYEYMDHIVKCKKGDDTHV